MVTKLLFLEFCYFLQQWKFSVIGSYLLSHIALSCLLQSETVTQAFLISHNLDSFEEYQYFIECPSIGFV